ncbi:hypothetical protein FB451DRAFT_1039157, partial [Mycena latifolia]
EAVAQETSCYIFFTAHHIHATEPFLHYSSPCLTREGKTGIEEIVNRSGKLFYTLKNARHQDATSLQM